MKSGDYFLPCWENFYFAVEKQINYRTTMHKNLLKNSHLN